MKVHVRLPKATLDKLLKNMVVIVDTRENKTKGAIEYFQKRKVPYKFRKLDFGDYSCELQKNDDLGLPVDISLEKNVVIELKKDLEELSNNLTHKRTEFENEFIRAKEHNCDVHLVIEKGSWEDILNHKYNTNFNEKSFYNSLLSFQKKYDLKIHFVNDKMSGLHILRILQTELKRFLEE